MYRKILVPLDGSPLSAGILPYVRWLAHGLKVPVELQHVNDPDRLAPYSPPMQRGDYLEKVAASFSGIANVKCTIERGTQQEVIINMVTAEPETLVAMATHGYSGAALWLLGGVAEKVLRRAYQRRVIGATPGCERERRGRTENSFGAVGLFPGRRNGIADRIGISQASGPRSSVGACHKTRLYRTTRRVSAGVWRHSESERTVGTRQGKGKQIFNGESRPASCPEPGKFIVQSH